LALALTLRLPPTLTPSSLARSLFTLGPLLTTTQLTQGKFWGVEHDLRMMRGAGMRRPDQPPFTARFDVRRGCTTSIFARPQRRVRAMQTCKGVSMRADVYI
jgi:hypothetical protein